jgi:hypothetical protein
MSVCYAGEEAENELRKWGKNKIENDKKIKQNNFFFSHATEEKKNTLFFLSLSFFKGEVDKLFHPILHPMAAIFHVWKTVLSSRRH